jgi:hypothetical protein
MSSCHVIFCNGAFVVWAPFAMSTSEAWQYARYARGFGSDAVRVFPCESESAAYALQSILSL